MKYNNLTPVAQRAKQEPSPEPSISFEDFCSINADTLNEIIHSSGRYLERDFNLEEEQEFWYYQMGKGVMHGLVYA